MGFLDDQTLKELRSALGDLPSPVAITLFTRARDCATCDDLAALLGEVAGAHPSIRLEVLDADAAPGRAAALGIEETPAFVVAGAEDRGVRFLGTPGGLEFATLIHAIRSVSRGTSDLAPALRARLAALPRPVRIRVFVTPTCPYCPPAVATAHQIALASNGVRAEMVEAMEFPELADRYGVRGVPRIVIDDKVAIDGMVPAQRLVDAVVQAASAA
jgi:glutaredoxin-like protein